MIENPIICAMLNRRSVRKYKPDIPSDEVIEAVVRAGQQAPFASQLYSVVFTRGKKHPYKAPLLFYICADVYKLERFMKIRGWDVVTNDLSLLVFAIQDAAYMAENMVMAAESLGMGSCFLGSAPFVASKIAKQFKLPTRVLPIVGLTMGYPAEEFPPRPRYPLWFSLFEDKYPEFTDEQVAEAMKVMDDGYLAQDYYRRQHAKIDIEDEIKAKGKQETYDYDTYSWTEHISRKWGQWFPTPEEFLKELKERGFNLFTE